MKEGAGTMKPGSGAYKGPFTFASRFESGKGTNPEELIGAARAGCSSMFLSALLSNKGFVPTIRTTATVHLEAGPTITLIELDTEAQVPGIDEATFQQLAAHVAAIRQRLTQPGKPCMVAASSQRNRDIAPLLAGTSYEAFNCATTCSGTRRLRLDETA